MGILQTLKQIHTSDKSSITVLYTLSEKSIIAAFAFIILTIVFLFSALSYKVIIWGLLLTAILLYRLNEALIFKKNTQRYSTEMWHRRFMGLSFLTATIVSLLGVIGTQYVDAFHQLFIITILVGFSSGATTSLSSDLRIAIGYITIILIPLSVTVLYSELSMKNVIVFLLFLYFITQLTIIIKSYKQNLEIIQLKENQMNMQELFKEAPVAIFSYDKELQIVDHNRQFDILFNRTNDVSKGLDLRLISNEDIIFTLEKAINGSPQVYKGPYHSFKDQDFWLEVKSFPFHAENNEVEGIVIIDDKTKEHLALEELAYMAKHDELTGLLNRRGFKSFMEALVNDQKHKQWYSLLFYLDLDEFKGINDSLGHSIGDQVLKNVAERLTNSVTLNSKVFRLGGDEFVIVFPYVSEDSIHAKEEAKIYAKRVRESFANIFIIDELSLHMKASIGIILIEPKDENIEEIIRHADLTMYQAKKAHKHLSYYNKEFDKKQKELFVLQNELGTALAHNQFEILFQPIVRIKDDSLVSVETLIRWNHPIKGVLMPTDFIPLAIKAGLLYDITWWIVENICRKISQWKREERWSLEYISINVNAQQLIEEDFAVLFLQKLEKYHIRSDSIIIEITERSLIDNFENAQGVINTLQDHGIKCAIDDFGIGYSSLSYLKRLSFHTLKIDREFVKDIESSPKDRLLLSKIIEIGREFQYQIVVEGVENENQIALLFGLDEQLYYQGYHFSMPMSIEAFENTYLQK
ncbi:MAG: EAL domain-containing protein [Campylobacterales bacterium]|nr:EAL domain-containing protein [Campylobacterales bacterium]